MSALIAGVRDVPAYIRSALLPKPPQAGYASTVPLATSTRSQRSAR